jgi:dipeptidyl aminopeptidase/acylaminoacyl peptidase
VEACVAAGIADDDRVGITGVSGGGLMSAWAIGQTDRFAAAIPISCVSNWLSFHNTANIGRFDELFLQADPYEPDGNYFHQSPVVHAHKATTPTLVLHGEADLVTPLGQAQELYQALVEAGCTTELVTYPREGHGNAWIERHHLNDCWERMRSWFDRYVRDR